MHRPCPTCARTAARRHEYFHVPKLFTWAGIQAQAHGAATIATTLWKLLSATPASRTHGRRAALKLALLLWINHWSVLERRGWIRADLASDNPGWRLARPGRATLVEPTLPRMRAAIARALSAERTRPKD